MTLNSYITSAPTPTPFVTENYLNSASNDYLKNRDLQTLLSKHIRDSYGSIKLSSYIDLRAKTESIYDVVAEICTTLYMVNQYKYNGLYESTQLEYNPIENYSMTESGLDERSGTNKNNIGSQTTTDTLGSQTITDTHGAESGNDITTEKIAPYDSSTFNNQSQTDVQHTKQSVTDSRNMGNKTDTSEQGAREDSGEFSESTNHTFSRSGNIGVTTSQQMLESERQIRLFNFLDVVAKDILARITVRIYEESEDYCE